jgi:predicted dehydrogenase
MKTIGLVGVNTFHAEAFTRIFNGDGENAPRIEGARITHVWAGEHPARLAELEGMFGPYDNRVEDVADLVGTVDGVLVVDDTDGGARHAELARPFLEAGMPVFVDKPMTTVYADAVALFDLAEKHDAPLMSSSALRFPVELDREAIAGLGKLSTITSVGPEEWFYYGVHAVEVTGAVTNDQPVSVHRFALPEKDVAVVEYQSGLVGVIMTLRDAGYLFHVTVYGEKGHLDFAVGDFMGFYTNEMRAFVGMIETREMPVLREQTLAVMAILHAGNLSADEGRTVMFSEITGGER